MSKEYVFDFSGTKEDFLNILKGSKHDYASGDYYLGDYRVKFKDDEIHFGVERGGHSGGYWFIPTITEFDDRIEFRGTIRCIDPSNNRGAIRKTIDSIGVFLFFILISPIVLILKLYTLAEWIVRKMRNCPKPKEKTTEERLFDLMENHFGCVGKIRSNHKTAPKAPCMTLSHTE